MITSLKNPRIKQLVRLRDRKERDSSTLFLIEGYRELLRAVDSGLAVEELYFCPEFFLGSNENRLIERVRGEKFICSKEVFKKVSYRDRPDGLLAVAKQVKRSLQEITFKNVPFIAIAESIEKPGNLGTILRTADAAGLDAVIVCDRKTDIYNPNVVRASIGTLFTTSVVQTSSADALQWLKSKGIEIIAATPSAKCLYTEADLTKPIAIAFGAEQYGLTDLWMENASCLVKIPMHGIADSLNVAMSTGILLYEAGRQRGFHDRI